MAAKISSAQHRAGQAPAALAAGYVPGPCSPGDQAWLEKLSLNERRRKALALASLLAIAARECSAVAERAVSEQLREGLNLIEDDHIEELADLLGLAPKRPPEEA